MENRVIELYEKFQCLAGECPYSCCKGWRVQIDDATYQKYIKEPGLLGMSLCMASQKHAVYGHLMHKVCGKCPFQNKEKLCSLQCKGREDLMPEICRLYPRLSVSYGEEQEVILELSCIHMAELFMQNLGRLKFVKSEKEIPVFWAEENDDIAFLDFLKRDRENILDYWWAEENMSYQTMTNKMKDIFLYVYKEYENILRQDFDSLEGITLPVRKDSESKDRAVTFYPLKLLNGILYHWFTGIPRNLENVEFYRLLRKYKKYFGKLYESEADDYFTKIVEEMLTKYPEYKRVFQSYYSYLLQETYLRGYGNYYIIKSILLSTLFTEYLILFYSVMYLESKKNTNKKDTNNENTNNENTNNENTNNENTNNENTNNENTNNKATFMNKKQQAWLIMIVEKALRHNEVLEELMMSRIREELFQYI